MTLTRELAAQVHDSFKLYARDLKFVSTVIFGVGMNPPVQTMARGVDVFVVAATWPTNVPLTCPTWKFWSSRADRMLDGRIHDVKPRQAANWRQNLLFSATFSKDITDLAGKLLHNPERIEVTPPNYHG